MFLHYNEGVASRYGERVSAVEKPPFRFKRVLLIALLALIVVMIGLVMLINYLPVAPGTFDAVQISATLDPTITTTEVSTFEVTSAMVDTTLHLTLTVEGGAAGWTLTDPAGTVQWEGELAAGQSLDEIRSFAPVVGLWTLALDFGEASGEYAVEWHGIR